MVKIKRVHFQIKANSFYYLLKTFISGKFSDTSKSVVSGVIGGMLVIIVGNSEGNPLVLGVLSEGMVGMFEWDEWILLWRAAGTISAIAAGCWKYRCWCLWDNYLSVGTETPFPFIGKNAIINICKIFLW